MVVDNLVALALDDPGAAEAEARSVLARADLSAADRSRAHQALGIVHRERHDGDAALRELRVAVRWAVRSSDPQRLGDVRASLGATLVVSGRPREGLRELDAAVACDADSPLTRMRRGVMLAYVARYDDACRDLRAAIEGFRSSGDRAWEAHSWHNLGFVQLQAGRIEESEAATTRARDLLLALDLPLEALWAEQNLGEIALARGDLPRAIAVLDRVAAAYTDIGHERASLVPMRCRALLTAGLALEAAELATAAIEAPMEPLDRRGLLLIAASAHLDADRTDEAAELAAEARDLALAADDRWLEARAGLVLVRAGRRRGRRDAREEARVARDLDHAGAAEAPLALVLAAESAAGQDRAALLADAERYRTAGVALTRASGLVGHGGRQGRRGGPGGRAPGLWPRARRASTSTAARWGAPSCVPWRPATGASWRGWPCATPPRRVRAPCWRGASGGGRRRWPSHR